jgi:malate dehydrogenase
MSFIAIVGAGAIGGALAHRLALRDRVRRVRLIDPEGRIAEGKALDIAQSSPVDGSSTQTSGAAALEAAAGADAVVIADAAGGGGEFAGEPGLALVRRIAAVEQDAPLIFAGAGQRELMARTIGELHVGRRRVIGSAPGALEAAVRALTALEVNGTGAEVHLIVAGVPPNAALVAWEEATIGGQPVSAAVPPHRLVAISAMLPSLWPPGPQALASAAARVVEAVAHGSRRRFSCFVSPDAPGSSRVVGFPATLGRRGVERVLRPTLSRQEQTLLENAENGDHPPLFR